MTERTSSSLTELKVPPEFAKYNDVVEADTIVRLEEWKQRAYHVLSQLRADLQNEQLQTSSQQAELAYAVAAFDGDDPWIDQSTRDIAQGQPPSTSSVAMKCADIVRRRYFGIQRFSDSRITRDSVVCVRQTCISIQPTSVHQRRDGP